MLKQFGIYGFAMATATAGRIGYEAGKYGLEKHDTGAMLASGAMTVLALVFGIVAVDLFVKWVQES